MFDFFTPQQEQVDSSKRITSNIRYASNSREANNSIGNSEADEFPRQAVETPQKLLRLPYLP